MNAYTKRRGVTILEFILAMLIGTTVFIVIGNILSFSLKSLPHAERERDAQIALRASAEIATKKIESATAIFLLPNSGLSETTLRANWNYLGLSDDGSEIVNYAYDEKSGRHDKSVLANGSSTFIYDLGVNKRPDGDVIDLTLSVVNSVNASTKSLRVAARALNANYIDAVLPGAQTARAFAYRSRRSEDEKVVGAVSFVIDTSASMNRDLRGNTTANDCEKRIVALENALLGHADKQNVFSGVIDQFSAEDAVELAIIPFNMTANIPLPNKYTTAEDDGLIHSYQFYDVAEKANREALFKAAKALSDVVGNGSNVGDALRRAHYSHARFAGHVQTSTKYGSGHTTKDYMVIVLDGPAAYASCVGGSGTNRYKSDAGDQQYLTIRSDPTNWQAAGIIGYGDKSCAVAEQYVELFGAKIKAADVRTYVVAYTESVADLSAIRDIADAVGADSDHLYAVTASRDIDAILTDIKADITEDLWSVRGPK